MEQSENVLQVSGETVVEPGNQEEEKEVAKIQIAEIVKLQKEDSLLAATM